MKFNGTIIITDPCYLAHGMSEELDRRLWDESDCGEDLSVFGLTQWISESTIYGDWSCHTYKGTKEEVQNKVVEWDTFYKDFFYKHNFEQLSEEEKDKLREDYFTKEKEFVKENTLGRFCADAGMVCVVYLEEVLKVNPHFKQWADEHNWCVTIIENFDGNVEYEIDENGEAHIVGLGNINFYTSQSGF